MDNNLPLVALGRDICFARIRLLQFSVQNEYQSRTTSNISNYGGHSNYHQSNGNVLEIARGQSIGLHASHVTVKTARCRIEMQRFQLLSTMDLYKYHVAGYAPPPGLGHPSTPQRWFANTLIYFAGAGTSNSLSFIMILVMKHNNYMLLFGKHPLWFGLNTVRVLSVIILALVIAVNTVVMVRDANAICREMKSRAELETNDSNRPSTGRTYITSSTVPLQPGGPFFAILSRLLTVCQCLILIFAELEWLKELFAKFLPIMGPGYGVGILGTMQVLLSAIILSHHIPKFVLVSGLLLFAIGNLNIILGLIFRNNIHLHRAWAIDKLQFNQFQDTQLILSNRRTSFRPGGERPQPVAQSLAARSRIPTDLEKPLSCPPSYGSKSDGHGCSEMFVYYNRSSQHCVEKGRESIPFPEQAHAKY